MKHSEDKNCERKFKHIGPALGKKILVSARGKYCLFQVVIFKARTEV